MLLIGASREFQLGEVILLFFACVPIIVCRSCRTPPSSRESAKAGDNVDALIFVCMTDRHFFDFLTEVVHKSTHAELFAGRHGTVER